jgi:tellurite resistance protein
MIPYIRVGAVVVCLALVGAGVSLILVQRAKLDAAEATRAAMQLQLDGVIATNKLQAESIDRLSAQSRIDDRLVTLLNQELSAIRTETEAATNKLTELERTSPDVKEFLAARVPDDLRKLLGR